jgi:hypothetical protein
MAYETRKVAQYLPTEKAIIFTMGNNEYGLLYDDKRGSLEIWVDHGGNGNGSGCNNLILDAFDKELDLEFCRSETLGKGEPA